MNIANLITLLRLMAVPFLIFFMVQNFYAAAFWIFVGASLSDALDGYLARRFQMETTLGKYLDPLADKALVMSAYIILGIQNALPLALVIIVIARDVLIMMGVLYLKVSKKTFQMQPCYISKLNTILQMALVVLALESLALPAPIPEIPLHFIIVGVFMTTLLSALSYSVDLYRATKKNG